MPSQNDPTYDGLGWERQQGNLILSGGPSSVLDLFAVPVTQTPVSATDAMTAHAGGGQGSATPIVSEISRFTTVATIGDSCILPTSVPGTQLTIINAGAASMNVFPQSGDQINALGANAAFAMAATKVASFYCTVAGQWHSILSA